jgi:hypothetical protein
MLAVVPLVSLTDRQSARRIYLASSTLSALACFGVALCDSLLPALGFRAAAGIALAGMYMPGLQALTRGVEGTIRAKVFGIGHGTVDKFIGDSVMVFWNAPHLQLDHVERACRAALAAKAASEALNTQFEAEGLPPFAVRLGIHFGDAVVGNVGSAERMNYTALGNSVNLAARLEGLNKEYGTTILVSEAVRNRVEHCFRFKAVASVIAKGMTTETQVYELVEAVA